MKHASDISPLIAAINERHVAKFDKFFRMSAGASSQLTELRERSFHLEIKIDRRVTDESIAQLIWNIAQSWQSRNPELGQCIMCVVNLLRSPGPTGFMLPAGRSREDADAGMDPREIAARILEIERTSKLPAPLLARYFLSFTLFEGIGKIQEMPPPEIEN